MKDEDLLRYLDGELSPREARDIERELEGSADSRTKLAAMRQLGEVLVARFEEEVAEVEPALSASWQRISTQLPSVEPRDSGLWARLRDWFEVYRTHVLTGAVAAAAGAFVAIWIRGAGGAATPAAMTAGLPAEVESLEVENGSGTIFQIPSDDSNEPMTTVIWVTPTDTDGDGIIDEPAGKVPL